MICERTFVKNETNSYSLGNLPNKLVIKDKTKGLGSQKVGIKNGQPKVIKFEYFIMLSKTKTCKFQHVLLHPKE
jgi:hypothetical protein